MTFPTLTASITIGGQIATIDGRPPFGVSEAGAGSSWGGWMLIDTTEVNCVTFPDGLKAIFDSQPKLARVAQNLNEGREP